MLAHNGVKAQNLLPTFSIKMHNSNIQA